MQASAPVATPEPASGGFVFRPVDGHLACSSFSVPFKVLAMLLVTLSVGWTWKLWLDGHWVMTLNSGGWLLAALGMMVLTEWHILRGKTQLDGVCLQQSWVWHKRVALNELAFAKVIRVRGFEWLIAPRLYTKTFSGKLAVFYACAPDMLAEFDRLAAELGTLRNQR
jgi:hypothetical protein